MVNQMQLLSERLMETEAWAAAISSSHEEIAIADTEGNILVASVSSLEVREHYIIPKCRVRTITFAGDRTQLIVGTSCCGVWWVDRLSKQLRQLHLTSLRYVGSLTVSPSDQWLAIVGDDDLLYVGGCSPKNKFREMRIHEVPNPNSVAFSPDLRLLAVGGGEGSDEHARVGLVDLENFSLRHVIDLGEDAICVDTVCFGSVGDILLAGGYKEWAIIRLAPTPIVETTLPASSWCCASSFYLGGRGAVVGDEDGEVTFYNFTRSTTMQYQFHGKVLCIDSLADELVDIVVAQPVVERRRWSVRVMRSVF